MAVEKLSISLDVELARVVRAAAAEQGVSVSTWLAEAAEAWARQRHLGRALDTLADEVGPLTDEDVDRLVAQARSASVVTGRGQGTR